MLRLANFIDGQFQPPVAGQYLPLIEPATGQVYGEVPDSEAVDVAAAIAAAEHAFPAWSALPAPARSAHLMRVAETIHARAEELAQAESRDNGKPLSLARRVDIPRAEDNFRFFAHAITQFHSEAYDMGPQGFNYTLRRPLGVVGLISPWNLPLYLFTWKIAPALAAGNTAVAKPSEITPATAALLGDICREAGLPAGVLNIVHGRGPAVGEAIVTAPAVKAVSFTGSTAVGRRISELATPTFKKLSLEMGGKNANLVFADAPYEEALATSVRAAFTNQGQICLCGSRILVEQPLYERFVEDFVARTRALKVGDPLAEDTDIGAIVSEAQWQKDQQYLEIARAEGGSIRCGGQVPPPVNARCAGGYFLEPTVITGLGPQCRVNQEEIFGPVVSIYPFADEEEGLAFANSTPYGLSATLWTSDLRRAHRVAARLEAGIVWINSWMVRDLRTPFGGMKQSGVGREGGMEALRFFTEAKNVFVAG
ncbi:MAG: aldehyde dehydrogenase [Bacteroidetes bacterium]|nr:MAG: aldehyde dehydrogenase [Bacteroidota bacterium]